MKVKLIAVLVVVAAVFISAVLWRTDSFVYGDRLSWVEAQTRTQLGAINRSVLTELKSLQRVVATFTPENFQKGKLNWNSLAPYYAAASFNVRGEALEPQTLLIKENSKAVGWTTEFVKSAVGSVSPRTADTRYLVKPFQDSQRGRYVALIFIEGSRAYALFGSGETFQSLIDAQRGALSSFSIVTNAGLTIGHSIPEYLGTVMRDDPVFKIATGSGSSHGSQVFKLASGELYGMYELVPQTNMLVISSAPLSEVMKGRTGLWWQFLLMGCGLMAVGVAVILWVIMPVEKKIEQLESRPAPATVAVTPPTPVNVKATAEDPEKAHKERMEASMRVASALAHEMQGPLASILGFSQTILSTTPSDTVVESTESIIRETRSARGVLDKLLGFAGENKAEKNLLKIEGPLVKALKELDPFLSMKGVKVIKDIRENSDLQLHVDAIIRALKNIIQNSVEAMERMPKKEIKISLFDDAEGTHLVIEDSGEGIEPQNIQKIFDPFFTTRSFMNHMGLGLSVSFGILKEHGAEFAVESQRGQGTKVKILFRKEASSSLLKAPVKVEETVMVAADLPRLKEDSQHRDEAEQAFVEAKTQETSGSPVDVNIEKLLELPELGATDNQAPNIPPPPQTAPAFTPPKPPPPSFVNDELTFLDPNFLAPASEAPEKTAVSPAEEETVIQASEAVADFKPNHISPPSTPVVGKTSKADAFKVEIRKPGKRV